MEINWNLLLHELTTGKCILCIGPDIYYSAEGIRIEQKLADTLRQKSSELGLRVYEDGWFHYLKDGDELATWFEIKQFYETQLPYEAKAIFQSITQLPFHLILNFTPDYLLKQVFLEEKRPFHFRSLNKTIGFSVDKSIDEDLMNSDIPVVFNILGEIEQKDSLVMTYDDLFAFMESIFGHKQIPDEVRLQIQDATYFIFLGMPLDKWYFHLFMRVLNMHKRTTKIKRVAASFTYDEGNATFCEEQYTLTFVKEDVPEFIKLLTSKWKEIEQKGTENVKLISGNQWRTMIGTGELDEINKVFDQMKESIKNNEDLLNQFTLIQMQWRSYLSTSFETEKSEIAMKTQIIRGVIYLIDQLEELNLSGL